MKGFLFADYYHCGRSRGNNLEVVVCKIIVDNADLQEIKRSVARFKPDDHFHVSKLDSFGILSRKLASFSSNYNRFHDFLFSFRIASADKTRLQTNRWYTAEDIANCSELIDDEELIKIFEKTLEQMPKGTMSSKIKKQIIEQITSNLL